MEKNYPRIHAILMDLLNRKEVTMAALCIQHNVSDRTIRNELSIIKQILQDYGLRLYKKKMAGIPYRASMSRQNSISSS